MSLLSHLQWRQYLLSCLWEFHVKTAKSLNIMPYQICAAITMFACNPPLLHVEFSLYLWISRSLQRNNTGENGIIIIIIADRHCLYYEHIVLDSKLIHDKLLSQKAFVIFEKQSACSLCRYTLFSFTSLHQTLFCCHQGKPFAIVCFWQL